MYTLVGSKLGGPRHSGDPVLKIIGGELTTTFTYSHDRDISVFYGMVCRHLYLFDSSYLILTRIERGSEDLTQWLGSCSLNGCRSL